MCFISAVALCQSRLKYILLLTGHSLKTSNDNQGLAVDRLTRKFLKKNSFYKKIKKYLAVTTSFPSQILLQFVRNKVTSISLQSSQEGRKGLKIKKNNIDKVLFLVTKPSTHILYLAYMFSFLINLPLTILKIVQIF